MIFSLRMINNVDEQDVTYLEVNFHSAALLLFPFLPATLNPQLSTKGRRAEPFSELSTILNPDR